jgi:hypothetical protein
MSYIDPDRHLNPPEPKAMPECEWEAAFKCHIGDEGVLVNVFCLVTINDDIDLDSLYVEHKGVDITGVLNSEHRKEIVSYFERNFEDIKDDCY